MNVSIPRFTFLSCAISAISASASGKTAGDVFRPRRQPDLGQVADRPRGFGGRQEAEPGREFEGERHAGGDRLAMQQAVGKAAGRLQRVAESVAEIKKRPVAGLALVARHDRGLGAAAHRDGVLARPAPEVLLAEDLPPANTSRQLASSQEKKAASPSRPYLATSA